MLTGKSHHASLRTSPPLLEGHRCSQDTSAAGNRKVSPSVDIVQGRLPAPGLWEELASHRLLLGSPVWPLSLAQPSPAETPPSHCGARVQVPGAEQRLGGGRALPCAMGGGPRAGTTEHFVQACLCSSICLYLSIWRPPAHLSLPARLFPLKLEGRPSVTAGRGGTRRGRAWWRLAGLAGPEDAVCQPPFPLVTCPAAVGHSPSSQAPGLLAWLPAPLPPFPCSVQCGGEVWRGGQGDQGGVGLA